ncbi:glycosyltransferase family 39 protein [Natronorubrum aibiense]|uniref:Phospholipid carrier-dependent glycosyltransferase n=1 Tax=Natronorubrum aibiense TaxID=348826 RepID=A0A5P9P6Z6_9EURY|nr:glycosyltransferase family 39 protein [Natronorubrum aibiense]QFU83912.1 phospholipid carrier-dependent glycosyltransferase [Natronorubrum aibiense]
MSRDTTSHVIGTWNRLPELATHHVLLAGILVLAAFFRGYDLGADSLWIDEVFSVHIVSIYSYEQLLFELPLEDPHPPLYFVLLNEWTAQFGATTVMARVPSVLFGVATIYLLYVTGRTLFDVQTGLLAALFLTVSPMHIQFSREARMYAMLVFLVVLSMYCFVRLLEGDRSLVVKGGYVVVSILMIYTHVYAFFVILAQAVSLLLWVVPNRWPSALDTTEWGLLLSAVGAGSLPFVTLLASTVVGDSGAGMTDHIEQPTPDALLETISSHAGALVNYPFAVQGSVSLVGSAIVLVCCVALIGRSFVGYEPGVDGTVRQYLQREYLLLTWVVIPIGVPFAISYLITPMFDARYTIIAQGALWLLVAHGLTRLDRSWLRWLVAVLLVTSLFGAGAVYMTEGTQEDWRGAAESVDEQPSHPVFLTPEYAEPAFSFYADRPSERISTPPPDAVEAANDPIVSPDETAAETEAAVAELSDDTDRFYVVALGFDASESWLEDVESRFDVVSHEQHGSIEVYLFDVDGDESTA